MAASDITLYWGSGSPPCWRVQLVLEEKGLSGYNSKMVSFDKKEHKGPEIMAINPRGQVPTLKVGDVVVCESIAAVDFLDAKYASQGNKLTPDDLTENALVLQRKYEALNVNKKLFEDFMYWLRMTKAEDRSEEALAAKKQALLDELAIWDGYLKQTGAFAAGSNFSLADVMLFPSIAFIYRLGGNLANKFPSLDAYYKRVEPRPSVQASWPPHWKTGAGPDMLKDLC